MTQGISERTGGFIVVIATLFFALILYTQASHSMSEEAALFPQLLAVILCVAAVIVFCKTLSLPRSKDGKRLFAAINWNIFLLSAALWLTTIFLLPYLGFYASIFCFMVAQSFLLADGTDKKFFHSCIFSFVATVLLWCVFSLFLRFSMPSGVFM